MTVSEVALKMIARSGNNRRDVNHFLKVWAYARTIGAGEALCENDMTLLEVTALLHDIACPLCREKYGSTDGKLQEKESGPLVRDFLKDSGFSLEFISRAAWLTEHHHTLVGIDDAVWQILIEADFLVNADEGNLSESAIRSMNEKTFKTAVGKALLCSLYGTP